MILKAYGMECDLQEDRIILKPSSYISRKALDSDERIIFLNNIIFLDFKDGNMFLNARIIIGEPEGKTYIPIVPFKDNVDTLKLFYEALYARVEPLGYLTGKEPQRLRNDRIQSLRDAQAIQSQAEEGKDALPTETSYEPTNKAHSTSIKVTEYESSMPPIVAKEYAIIDLETTGLSPDRGDRIIEIGVMIVDAGYNIISKHETLINPKRPVALTEVHKITDKMLDGAPTIDEVRDDVLALLHKRIVVAHNASFEQKFLNHELDAKKLTSNNFLDTLKYARLITPTENHKLGTVANYYNVPYVDSHTAMGDVIILHKVLAAMLPASQDSKFIASEELTPYFHPDLGDSDNNELSNLWLSR